MATTTLPRLTFPAPDVLEARSYLHKDDPVRWTKAEAQAWEEEGHALAQADNKSKWDLGEWIHRGLCNELPNMEDENAYSFTISAAEKITSLAKATLYRLAQVYRAFPESRRREKPWGTLSWSHFNEVLPVKDKAVQDQLLTKAAVNKYSVSYLRTDTRWALNGEKQKNRPPKLKPEELKQYRAFEVPLDRVVGISEVTVRVTLLEPEFKFLVKLSKARNKKKPGEVIRELLAESAKTHFQAWKNELETTPAKKRHTRTKVSSKSKEKTK